MNVYEFPSFLPVWHICLQLNTLVGFLLLLLHICSVCCCWFWYAALKLVDGVVSTFHSTLDFLPLFHLRLNLKTYFQCDTMPSLPIFMWLSHFLRRCEFAAQSQRRFSLTCFSTDAIWSNYFWLVEYFFSELNNIVEWTISNFSTNLELNSLHVRGERVPA